MHPPPEGIRFPAGTVVNVKDVSILVPIPAGEAIFGWPEGVRHRSEHPQFRATLPGYYLGAHPMTNAQWKRLDDVLDLRDLQRGQRIADMVVLGVADMDHFRVSGVGDERRNRDGDGGSGRHIGGPDLHRRGVYRVQRGRCIRSGGSRLPGCLRSQGCLDS